VVILRGWYDMIGRAAKGDGEAAPHTPEYNSACSDVAHEDDFRHLAKYDLYENQGRAFRQSERNAEHNTTCIVRLLLVLDMRMVAIQSETE
jgi:hypothetical protein